MVQLRTPHGLEAHGIEEPERVYWNLTTPALYEEAVRRHEGLIAQGGPIVFHTGRHTGRSPKDKYLVRESSTENDVAWGAINQPLEPERFEALRRRMMKHLDGKELFVQDPYAVTDPSYRLPVRIITEMAYHSMFSRNMFIGAPDGMEIDRRPAFTVIDAPSFVADPERDGTRSDVFIALSFEQP